MSKRARRKPSVARTWANTGIITPEYARKIGDDAELREIAEGTAGKATVLYVRTNPIAYLAGRKRLTPSQVEAAERLREDFDLSGLDPLKAQDYTRERVDGGAHKGTPEFRQEALDRFNAAIKVIPILMKSVVLDVVLRDVPLHLAESFVTYSHKRDQKTANRTLLAGGLIEVAKHYGLPVDW